MSLSGINPSGEYNELNILSLSSGTGSLADIGTE